MREATPHWELVSGSFTQSWVSPQTSATSLLPLLGECTVDDTVGYCMMMHDTACFMYVCVNHVVPGETGLCWDKNEALPVDLSAGLLNFDWLGYVYFIIVIDHLFIIHTIMLELCFEALKILFLGCSSYLHVYNFSHHKEKNPNWIVQLCWMS